MAWTQHRTRIKIVITDLMMPIMDGLTLAGVLRRINPSLPIIVSTGLGSGLTEELRAQLLAMGGTTFLNKPFSTQDLLQTLRTLLPA